MLGEQSATAPEFLRLRLAASLAQFFEIAVTVLSGVFLFSELVDYIFAPP